MLRLSQVTYIDSMIETMLLINRERWRLYMRVYGTFNNIQPYPTEVECNLGFP